MAGEKIDPIDQGGLKLKIGVDRPTKKVVVEFETAVRWIALSVEDAVGIAELILEKADFIGGLQREEAKRDGLVTATQVGEPGDRAPQG